MGGLVLDGGLNLLLVDLPVDLEALPEHIGLLNRPWRRKDELHVTVVSGPTVLENAEREFGQRATARAAATLGRFAGHRGVCWRAPRDELRLARRDSDETLVLMCDLEGVSELFDELSGELGIELELPPTHVTLYTRGDPIGIGTQRVLFEQTTALSPRDAQPLRRALSAALRCR